MPACVAVASGSALAGGLVGRFFFIGVNPLTRGIVTPQFVVALSHSIRESRWVYNCAQKASASCAILFS